MALVKQKGASPGVVNGAEVVAEALAITHSVMMAEVPDKSYFNRYIGRTIEGYSEFDLYGYAYESGQNVLLEGPTGPGKTMSVKAYAAKEDLLFYSIPSNVGVEPSQIFGKYIPDEGQPGVFVWQDGGATAIVRNGGVLLVNEINFMPDRVATALFGLLDDRREITLLDHRGEVVRAHRGGGVAEDRCWCTLHPDECNSKRVLVVADMNPDYSGTRPLNAALRNRFAIQIDWDYDPVVEAQLVKSKTLREIVAQRIRLGMKQGNFITPVSTNMLMEFEKTATRFGLKMAMRLFVNHFSTDERQAVLTVFQGIEANLESELPRDTVVVSNPDHYVFSKDPNWIYADRHKGGGK